MAELKEARVAMIRFAESLRDHIALESINLKKQAFACGIECVENAIKQREETDSASSAIQKFNLCVRTCQEPVNKVDNIARTYLDALSDRVETCLTKCYGDATKDLTKWSVLNDEDFGLKVASAQRCYQNESEWLGSKKQVWMEEVKRIMSGKQDSKEVEF